MLIRREEVSIVSASWDLPFADRLGGFQVFCLLRKISPSCVEFHCTLTVSISFSLST